MLKRTRKGMTLIELIVVIVILGILAAIAIPTFDQVIKKSQYSSLETTAHAIDSEGLALAAFDNSATGDVAVDPNATTAGDTYFQQAAVDLATNSSGNGVATVKAGTAAKTYTVSNGTRNVCITLSGEAGVSGSVVDGPCA